MKRILFATVLCLLAASAAFGQTDVNIGPFQVRIQGYIGDPPKGVKAPYTWTVGRDGKVYKLSVMKHESLSTTLSTMDINNKVYMYSPNFNLDGDDKSIKAFTGAKPGQLLLMTADMRVDTQPGMLELNTVTPIDAVKDFK
jgi:hypothetical protein